MDRLGTRRRHVASIPRDDTQGRTRAFLGLCRKTPRNWDQKEVLKLKTAENRQKTSQNQAKTAQKRRQTQGADSRHYRLSRQVKFQAMATISGTQKQRKTNSENSQNVKNPDKNRTKQRPANPERRARCCSGPPEKETQAAPHVGSSPESPTRAMGASGSSK